jgi:hypothetical protein
MTSRKSSRKDRLVRPEAAAHYIRQGERLAVLSMSVHAAIRNVLARLRPVSWAQRTDGAVRPRGPFHSGTASLEHFD